MKKFLLVIIASLLFCSCADTQKTDNEKLTITGISFIHYDIVKALTKDIAHINTLLPPGGESHTFEPSAKDIITISNSDLLVLTGGESDTWAKDLISANDNENLVVFSFMDYFDTKNLNTHKIDEHVWTSPENMKILSENLLKTLIKISPQNKDAFIKNYEEYIKLLNELSDKFLDISTNSKTNILIFGDRFPFYYLAKDYNLECYSAFPGCSEESEPDITTILNLIDIVKKENIPVVFYTDFSNHKIADTICHETGAKLLNLRSCHSITKEEMKNGITYIDLMNKNVQNIKEALN